MSRSYTGRLNLKDASPNAIHAKQRRFLLAIHARCGPAWKADVRDVLLRTLVFDPQCKLLDTPYGRAHLRPFGVRSQSTGSGAEAVALHAAQSEFASYRCRLCGRLFLIFQRLLRFRPLCGASRVVASCRALCATLCAPFGQNKTNRRKFRTRRERCRLLSAGMVCLVGSVRASKNIPCLFYP